MFNGDARKALEIMSYAQDIHPMLGEGKRFRSYQVTARFMAGQRKFEAMLQTARAGGWLKSVRGPKGGYTLTDAGKCVTAWDVLARYGLSGTKPFLPLLKKALSGKTPGQVLAMIEAYEKGLTSSRL